MTEKKRPQVSVLMSVYNGEKYLRQAVESVLAQGFTDFELLVANDASTDSSREILTSYDDERIKIFDNKRNLGLTASLNKLISRARGEYLARLDADDVCQTDRLQKQVDYLRSNPEVSLVCSWVNVIDNNGERISRRQMPIGHAEIVANMLFFNPITHSSVMMRRDKVKQVGGYDKQYKKSQDYKLWVDIAVNGGKLACIADYLVDFREHESSITATGSSEQEGFAVQAMQSFYGRLLDMRLSTAAAKLIRRVYHGYDVQLNWADIYRLWRYMQRLQDSLASIFGVESDLYRCADSYIQKIMNRATEQAPQKFAKIMQRSLNHD